MGELFALAPSGLFEQFSLALSTLVQFAVSLPEYLCCLSLDSRIEPFLSKFSPVFWKEMGTGAGRGL